ncbi:16672_t:CDS:1, partial [Acaulospora morrowiae]
SLRGTNARETEAPAPYAPAVVTLFVTILVEGQVAIASGDGLDPSVTVIKVINEAAKLWS